MNESNQPTAHFDKVTGTSSRSSVKRFRLIGIAIVGVLVAALGTVWFLVDGPFTSKYTLSDDPDRLKLTMSDDAFGSNSGGATSSEQFVGPLRKEEVDDISLPKWCRDVSETLHIPRMEDAKLSISTSNNRIDCIWQDELVTATFGIDISSKQDPFSRAKETIVRPSELLPPNVRPVADCGLHKSQEDEAPSGTRVWTVDHNFTLFSSNEVCVYEIPDQERESGEVLATLGLTTGEPNNETWKESTSERWGYGMFVTFSAPTPASNPDDDKCCDQQSAVSSLAKLLDEVLPPFYKMAAE